MKKIGPKLTTQVLDIRVLKAECLFAMEKHEDAASLLNEHMPWSGAEEHLPTLIAYASFAMTYRKVEEPVRALLKAIVLDQKHKKTKSLLAQLLSSENGTILNAAYTSMLHLDPNLLFPEPYLNLIILIRIQ